MVPDFATLTVVRIGNMTNAAPNVNASKLEWALYLASLGFHVFPCIEKSKLPLIARFPTRATRDPEHIKKWWTDPILGFNHDYNVAISTSRYQSDSALWVVDIDNKGTKRGDHEILKLETEGFEFPETFEQATPTGGRHLVYIVDKAVRQSASRIAPGLDTRSHGGFILGAGSETKHGRYEIRGSVLTPARAPTWYARYGDRPDANRSGPSHTSIVQIDQGRAVLRAVEYLEQHAPLAIEGVGGDHTTYAVACQVKDFGVELNEAVNLLLNHWNERCSPPWQADELRTKVENAYNYGDRPVGAAAPETQFSSVVVHEKVPYTISEQNENLPEYSVIDEHIIQSELGSPLEKINRDHALVCIEGTYFVLHETIDEKGRAKRNFLTEAAFKTKFRPYTTQKSKKGKPVSWAEEWLDWENRREYAGLCFAPEREPRNGYYNLWRGFTCPPVAYEKASIEARRGFDTWIDHLRHNVCRGNPELETWLLTYFAHMIQRPYERPLTTLVFRGTKGVGKNALVDRVGAIFGGAPHYLVAHDSRYLTSNFNGHLDSCLCLVLDEAFWSGDKNAEGKLKGLTTAPEIMIERKSKEPYMVDNLVRMVVIGNEDWLVPSTNDERRWAVFDVSDGRKQDTAYFELMCGDIDERGGKAVLLHFLQQFDLRKANVNVAPKTAALLDQKHSSLEPLEQWWLDCLSAGYIVGGDLGADWPTQIQTDRFRAALRRYVVDRNVRARIAGDISVGRALKKIVPSLTKRKIREGQDLMYVYEIPALEQARTEWQKFIGHDIKWERI